MARVKVTNKGLEESLEALAASGLDVDATAARMVGAGGQVLLEGMQRRVPRDTENLANHLELDGPHQDGNFHYAWVGVSRKADADTARYGAVQEYGAADTPAQPYVRPTVAEDMGKARRAMVKVAKDAAEGK